MTPEARAARIRAEVAESLGDEAEADRLIGLLRRAAPAETDAEGTLGKLLVALSPPLPRWLTPALVLLALGLSGQPARLGGSPLALGLAAAAALAAMLATRRPWWSLGLSSGAALVGALAGPLGLEFEAHCLLYEVVLSLAPLGLSLVAARRHPDLDARALAAIAGSGALAGMAALSTHCPGGTHLLLSHFGGVLLASGIGATTGLTLRLVRG
jgi:hypothetical protein